jgi:hypothetical protein
MSETISLDEFLERQEKRTVLLATVEPEPEDDSVVRVSLWSEAHAGCVGCTQAIPRDNIEGVRPTSHRTGGREVVELVLKEDAMVPTRDILARSAASAMGAPASWVDRFTPNTYWGNLNAICYRDSLERCFAAGGNWRRCDELARRLCTEPMELAWP